MYHPTLHPGTQRGLTLVELLVTLGVALILLAVGTPLYSSTVENSRLTAATNALVRHVHLARSEAIKRGTAVTACASGDGATCAGSNAWELGWIVFVDGGTPNTVDGDDEILRVYPETTDGITIGASADHLRYLSDGSLDS